MYRNTNLRPSTLITALAIAALLVLPAAPAFASPATQASSSFVVTQWVAQAWSWVKGAVNPAPEATAPSAPQPSIQIHSDLDPDGHR